jgi:superfamily II DNA or RNA helicase
MAEIIGRLGEPVGMIGDNTWEPNLNGFTVAMSQTLASKLKPFDEKSEDKKLRGTISLNKYGKEVFTKSEAYKKAIQQGGDALRAYESSIRHRLLQLKSDQDAQIEDTKRLLLNFQFVILEEAHESSAHGYYSVMRACKNANYRLALTATPFVRDSEEANMRLMACSGPIGIRVDEKTLIDRGILAKPYFKFLKPPAISGLSRANWQAAYSKGIVHNEQRNQMIVQEAQKAVQYRLPVLILVIRTEHGKMLTKRLQQLGIQSQFLSGSSNAWERKEALSQLSDGRMQVLVASSIFEVGVDVPSLGMIILAGGGKAEVALRQRIGRGLRSKKSGPNVAFIVDFIDQGNKHLQSHSEKRRQIIANIDGFKEGILQDQQDFDWSLFK